MKKCTICGIEKPFSNFAKDKYRRDGYSSKCKECDRQRCREWYAKNAEQAKERIQKYQCVNAEADKARRHEWYLRNRDRRSSQTKAYRHNNRDLYRSYSRAYRKADPYKHREYVSRYRARKAGVDSTLTLAEWKMVVASYESKCAYCGIQLNKPTQDHIIPLIRGGTHSVENVVPACASCNSKKHDSVGRMIPSPLPLAAKQLIQEMRGMD